MNRKILPFPGAPYATIGTPAAPDPIPLHRRPEPLGLPWDECRARPAFACPANHPLNAWHERSRCNGGGWVCGTCHPI